ncbi:DUF6531 domain-containing protein [Amycolatopsis pigmentata]|uniref:DUF6531 domain-containing protein n=1 Tax=Amycolatopsis pigmentata TaxID=450801 RepID=A0ABW5G448_9PSEU
MSNPLVASKQDSTTWHSGISVLDDAAGVYDGVQSGSWIEGGLAAFGTGMDLLTMAMNPVGTLISYGLNWLIEHVQPLQDALNHLAGDADQIAAYSQTWKNVAESVKKAAQDLASTVEKDTANWTGQAADTYRANLKNKIDHINAASTCAETISTVVQIVGVITGAVRGLVRDMVTQAVGDFIQDALEEVCSLGLGTPVVVAQVVEQVSAWIEKITGVIKKLINSVEKLRPMMSKLEEIFAAIKKVMAELHGRPGEEPHLAGDGSTHASSAIDEPHLNGDPGTSGTSTHASDAADAPDAGTATGTDAAGRPTSSDSGNSLRQDAENPKDRANEPVGRCGRKEPIDAATGEMFLVQTDADLPGVLPLVLERVHVSSYRSGRLFGPSWASTLDQRLEFDERGACYAGPSGVILVYPLPPSGGGEVHAEEGARWPLSRTPDGGYAIRQPETGRTLYFPPEDRNVARIATIGDRNGNRIDFEYDTTGVVTEVRHSGGYRLGVDSENGLVTGLRMRQENGDDITLAQYVYSGDRRLVAVLNSSNRPLTFEYDDSGRIVRWVDRTGQWYGYGYDGSGRCVRTEGSGNALTGTFEYDAENRITVETDSLGHVTTHQFNELHQLVRQVDPLGGETTQEWDGHDRLISRTDQLGRVTRYRYDEAGNLTTLTRPDGTQELAEYNEFRLPIVRVEPDGAVWRYGYDDRGNLISVTDPGGAETRYGRDDRGALESVVDPLGNVRRIETDAAGLPVRLTEPLGGVTTFDRDQFGRITAITDPVGGVTGFGWTVEGRLLHRSAPDGTTERWRYDAEGNQTEYVDALGQVTRTETTHFELPSAEIKPDGARLEFDYDTELRLISVRDPRGLVWRYEYDAAGRLVREVDFNGRPTSYTHDGAGQLIQRTNGAGESVVFVRDALGNVVERRSADEVVTFEFDAAERMVRAGSPDAEMLVERDVLGRVIAETVNGRRMISRYDAAGNRIYRRTPTGAESRWEYDADGRPVNLRTAGHTVFFGYDHAGREVERLLDTGTILTHAWDMNHRLTSQTVSTVTGRTGARRADLVQQRRYHYRPDGAVSAIDDRLLGSRRFDLDLAGRVTAVRGAGWEERYAYDNAGNVVTASWPQYSAEPEAQGTRVYGGTLIRQAGNVLYQHDAQGRLVLRQRKRLSRKPDTWHYRWNHDDRLVAVITPDGSHWRYRYDPLGRRIAKERLTPDGSVAERVDFSWDDMVLAEQIHSAGQATTWEWTPGTFRPLAQLERMPSREASQEWVDRQFYSIVTDLVGAPAELLDSSGNVAWQARTTLWGETTSLRNAAYTPLRQPGQYHDFETGLNYNYYRYYDASVARYASGDPLGLAAGPAPHSYVDNPTLWTDPLGLTATPASGCGPGGSSGSSSSQSNPPPVSRQKQDQHVYGTSEYNKRIANNTPTSYFNSRAEADAYAQHAWQHGTPVPGRPGVRDYDHGVPVGRGPNGGWQTTVRVHMDSSGRVHAHPKGREYP